MARLVFYEKPGCINNTLQKKMLLAAGHELDVRNLLEENWDKDVLKKYFDGKPVAEWFNQSAPQVKSGEVVPDDLSQEEALALMQDNPILIRRPLMCSGDVFKSGFSESEVNAWIGLKEVMLDRDLESCPRSDSKGN